MNWALYGIRSTQNTSIYIYIYIYINSAHFPALKEKERHFFPKQFNVVKKTNKAREYLNRGWKKIFFHIITVLNSVLIFHWENWFFTTKWKQNTRKKGQALHAILETMLCFLNAGTKIAQNKTLLKKRNWFVACMDLCAASHVRKAGRKSFVLFKAPRYGKRFTWYKQAINRRNVSTGTACFAAGYFRVACDHSDAVLQ